MLGPQFKNTRPVVPISELHYTQPMVNQKIADLYSSVPSRQLPTVYHDEGKLFIDDGHHRVEGAKRAGKHSIRVRHLGDAGGLLAGVHRPDTCPACGGTPLSR